MLKFNQIINIKNMLKKIGFFLIVLIIVLLINGCANQVINKDSNENLNIEKEEVESELLIGGQRDEHGCLGPAGYTWNEEIGACIREWELDEDQRRAVKTAIQLLSYPVTIVKVINAQCLGCFTIRLQRNDNQEMFSVDIENWEFKN